MPVTKQLNTDVAFAPDKSVYFCPGAVGGGEWSSAAFDPSLNLVFTGENDMGGYLRIVRANDGQELYAEQFDGGIAGGVITYEAKGKQYIAFTAGTSYPQWPVAPKTGKIVILALP